MKTFTRLFLTLFLLPGLALPSSYYKMADTLSAHSAFKQRSLSQNEILAPLEIELRQEPLDKKLIRQYMQIAIRSDLKNIAIAQYLEYHTAVKQSENRFDLEPLNPKITAKDIRIFLEKHSVSEFKKQFLLAEMIRRLKKGGWPDKGKLSKENIYALIFEKLITSEESLWLKRCTLLHLLGESGITNFDIAEQENFVASSFQNNITHPSIIFDVRHLESTTIHLNTGGLHLAMSISLQDADLREVNFLNLNLCGIDLSGADLTKANCSKTTMYGSNLIKTNLKETNFGSFHGFIIPSYLIHQPEAKTLVTQSQFETYFPILDRNDFNIKPDATTISSNLSALLPFFLFIGIESHLFSIASSIVLIYLFSTAIKKASLTYSSLKEKKTRDLIRLQLEKLSAQLNQRPEESVLSALLQKGEILNMAFDQNEPLDSIRRELSNDPLNKELIKQYMQTAIRANKTEEAIQQYLTYYSAVRDSEDPFDLEDLDLRISPEDIRQYIEKHIRSESLQYLQLEFLFAEMIRRLKLGDDYSPHSWTKTKSPLQKSKILNTIFKDLLSDWEGIPLLNHSGIEGIETNEQALKRLSVFILFHLLGETRIKNFELYRQKGLSPSSFTFRNSLDAHMILYNFSLNFRQYKWDPNYTFDKESTINFSKADFRYIKLNQDVTFYFLDLNQADFRHSQISSATFFQPKLDNTSFHQATLSNITFGYHIADSKWTINNTNFSKCTIQKTHFNNIFFKNVIFDQTIFDQVTIQAPSFSNVDFRKILFKNKLYIRDKENWKGMNTLIITEQQYQSFFSKWPRECFQIKPGKIFKIKPDELSISELLRNIFGVEPDENTTETNITAVAPLFLLASWNSPLVNMAISMALTYIFFKVIKQAASTYSSLKEKRTRDLIRLQLEELSIQLNNRSEEQILTSLLKKGKVLNMAFDPNEQLNSIRRGLSSDPLNKELIQQYMHTAIRTNKREEAIQQYLTYYSAVRDSKDPFDLEDLDLQISPEDIRQYIEKHIHSESLKYLQLEFLFAEMIRRLKLGPGYSPHSWPKTKSPLQKSKINKYLIIELLSDKNKIPALKNTNIKEIKTVDEALCRLQDFTALHFLSEKNIRGFSIEEQNEFLVYFGRRHMSGSNEITETELFDRLSDHLPALADILADGILPVERGNSFQKADLRYINLKHSVTFHYFNFYQSDFRNSQILSATFVNTEIDQANFSLSKINSTYFENGFLKNVSFDQAILTKVYFDQSLRDITFNQTILNQVYLNLRYFRNVDFRKAIIKDLVDSWDFIQNINGFRKITETQYKNFFSHFPRKLFQIEPDKLSISETARIDVSL